MEALLVKFMAPSGRTSCHTIHCKKHTLRKNSIKTPNNRTLFSVGWPPYCSENDLKQLFTTAIEAGDDDCVENVYLKESPGNVEEIADSSQSRTFKRRDFGYIVFKTPEGLQQAINLCRSKSSLLCSVKNTGLSVWTKHYSNARPSVTQLKNKAQRQIEKYDAQVKEDRKRRRLLSEPDEEGWVTVAKKPNFEPDNVPQSSKRKRKKQQTHLKLYPFQLRETQREKLAELRRKFEQDKKRVAEMKAQRKFKPF